MLSRAYSRQPCSLIMMTIMGSLGIGAVWGWLLVLVAGRQLQRPLARSIWPALAGIGLSSGALGGLIAMLSGPWQILPFAGAAIVFLILHQAWLAHIRTGLAEQATIKSMTTRR